MSSYHINPEGNPGSCSAQPGNCPYGNANEHYSSPEDARRAYERFQEDGSWGSEYSWGDKDSWQALRLSRFRDYFEKDGVVYRVANNSSYLNNEKEERLLVELQRLTADGFVEEKFMVHDDKGSGSNFSGFKPVASFSRVQKLLAEQDPNGVFGEAQGRGEVFSSMKAAVESRPAMNLEHARVGDLYVGSDEEGTVFRVLEVGRNLHSDTFEARHVKVAAAQDEEIADHYGAYYVQEDNPPHLQPSAFRRLSPQEAERFNAQQEALGAEPWKKTQELKARQLTENLEKSKKDFEESLATGNRATMRKAIENYNGFMVNKIHRSASEGGPRGRWNTIAATLEQQEAFQRYYKASLATYTPMEKIRNKGYTKLDREGLKYTEQQIKEVRALLDQQSF